MQIFINKATPSTVASQTRTLQELLGEQPHKPDALLVLAATVCAHTHWAASKRPAQSRGVGIPITTTYALTLSLRIAILPVFQASVTILRTFMEGTTYYLVNHIPGFSDAITQWLDALLLQHTPRREALAAAKHRRRHLIFTCMLLRRLTPFMFGQRNILLRIILFARTPTRLENKNRIIASANLPKNFGPWILSRSTPTHSYTNL